MRDNTAKTQQSIINWLLLLEQRGDFMVFDAVTLYGLSSRSFERYMSRASKALNVKYKLLTGTMYGRNPEFNDRNPNLTYVVRMT